VGDQFESCCLLAMAGTGFISDRIDGSSSGTVLMLLLLLLLRIR